MHRARVIGRQRLQEFVGFEEDEIHGDAQSVDDPRPAVAPDLRTAEAPPRLDLPGVLQTLPPFRGCSLVVKLLSSKEVSSVRFRPAAPN